ncbi:MAG: hypothetical protein ABI347_07415 [Nitrososphaera sp.]|jgi:hypothetical protein
MPLSDFLLPSENVKFASEQDVEYGEKKYNVYVTDKRLILYARRGLVMRSDDIVSERLESIHGVKYRETGFPFKTATISVWGTSTIDMKGPASRIKPLFHSLQSMVNNQ